MLRSSVRRETEVGWFVGGLFVGALASAFVLVTVGSLVRGLVPETGRVVFVGVLAVAIVLHELGVIRLSLPQHARQVPRWVIDQPAFGSFQFGAEMGTGMRTYAPTGLPHLAAVTVFLIVGWVAALGVGAGFAIGRAFMTLLSMTGDDAHEDFARMARWRQVFAVMTAVLMAVGLTTG